MSLSADAADLVSLSADAASPIAFKLYPYTLMAACVKSLQSSARQHVIDANDRRLKYQFAAGKTVLAAVRNQRSVLKKEQM